MIDLDGKCIGPDRFLSAARRYQIMPTIDRWVVEETLRLLKPHSELLVTRPVVFSINCSGQSLGDSDFADYLIHAIEKSGIEPSVLCIELTESDAVANVAKAELLIRRLKRLGTAVALDDFGTGLSSLAYLRALPVSILKIDGSFVRDILKDPRADSMVQAIAQLARTMSMTTVAEYVETDEIRNRIAAIGVDYAQGFAIGRPQPLEDVLAELPLYAAAAPVYVAPAEARLIPGHA
jgi:EAL domain-containing protein (putative c-di-GMP-specific phosphodiesterase class I)